MANVKSLKAIMRASWFTPGASGRWGLPLLFEGGPGNGKTAITEGWAKQLGLYQYTFIGSTREPLDFNGVMVPDAKGKIDCRPMPWAHDLASKVRGVVFADEINTAPVATQAAMLRMILDGYVGDMKLPNTIRFIGAHNSTDESVGGQDLAPPTANRFGHITWDTPSVTDWCDWLLGGALSREAAIDALDAAAEEARVEAAFPEPFAKARGLVAGFIKRRPELLYKMPPLGSPQASKAWPSPRTWEMAARALAGAQVHGLTTEESDEFVGAFIGQGTAIEFAAWREQVDLPDPAMVLDGKTPWKHEPKRLDRTVALFDACAALVTPVNAPSRAARAASLWKLLGTMMGDSPDLVVPAARALVIARLLGTAEASAVLKRIQPILAAAGITAGG